MLSFFDGHVFLSIFTAILLGTILGGISFGPIRFGAAGTLFTALALGAFINLDPVALQTLQNFGLGIFVYMLGLSAGETFIRGIRQQLSLLAATAISVIVGGCTAIGVAALIGASREAAVGVFAGSLTSTPSLAVAAQQTGSDVPAVGYSLAYPMGVISAILIVSFFLKRSWPARRDIDDSASHVFELIRVRVTHDITHKQLREEFGENFIIVSLRHKNKVRVANDNPELVPGESLRVLVTKAIRKDFVQRVGKSLPMRPISDPGFVIESLYVSNKAVAGNTVEELDLFTNFGARVVRIRRGDQYILASADTRIDYGDEIELVMRASRRPDLKAFFGDSVKAYSSLDWISVAGGLALSVLFSLITIPLPGGLNFTLGTALGPLIVGLTLGTVQRTGRIAWKLPESINTAFQQLGLMMFLAAVGLSSGTAFVSTAFSLNGLLLMSLGAIVVLATYLTFFVIMRIVGKSVSRAVGGASGILGQPAVLQYALSNSSDNRIMAGYTTTFAIAILVKILIIPLLLL